MYALEPFTDAVRSLMVDKTLRLQMGSAAKSYVRQFHDLNKNYQELEQTLNAIAKSRL